MKSLADLYRSSLTVLILLLILLIELDSAYRYCSTTFICSLVSWIVDHIP